MSLKRRKLDPGSMKTPDFLIEGAQDCWSTWCRKVMTHKAKNFIRELQPSEVTEKPALIFPVKQDWKIFDDGKGVTLLRRSG